MAKFFRGQNIHLVPHMKTHKTLELGKMMTDCNEKRRVVVSTLSEAEMFVLSTDPPFDEIIYAYHITPDKIPQCAALTQKAIKFTLLLENETILRALQKEPPSGEGKWNVLVEIDHLYKRTGLMALDPATLKFIQKVAASSNINYLGLYMHCGSSYHSKTQVDSIRVIKQSINALKALKSELKKLNINNSVLSIGSTPSCSIHEKDLFDGVDEVHPGNYVFYDAQQFMLSSCKIEHISGTVLTRVIANYWDRNTMVIDCGWEGLSGETPNNSEYYQKYGYARFKDYPHLKLLKMSQVRWRLIPEYFYFERGPLSETMIGQ